ncbi:hypothetical protein [Amycolatopsis vancoresmycina]|uniref:LigA protein n=1 Tax=Amycolatopsis vancoresmycina DSM 44592 TaxID=1292037 RepID=R1HY21_9PSEU|nr:hypothetical protein [Amycolatopsis vancoresmycina]EOD63169.1 hypothetical protein H480_38430 [Amycolatopsis vancoresmycina DSM 44592]
MRTDCGCGCGGTSARPSTFVRPRFFAGQLLTEDDLGLLVTYLTGKNRLHNRSLSGPGVVCGLEVSCDPCGGGDVVVHPGHALDCAGNDIVLTCPEKVDVDALVRELRVGGLGVDCGTGCDGDRSYGLFVRYEELPVEPVAPFATEEPCPSPGCVPSRVREGFKFVVKCDDADDHRHNPRTRLLASLGDADRFEEIRVLVARLGRYLDPLAVAVTASGRTFRFDAADAARFRDGVAWLTDNGSGEGAPEPPLARAMTEQVRGVASAIARFDTYDTAGQAQLVKDFADLGGVSAARDLLATACGRLAAADAAVVWPDPVHRAIAVAVVTETRARVVQPDVDAPAQVRLLAQGTPVGDALQAAFRADLDRIRGWLLGRLDQSAGGDCGLRGDVAGTTLPVLLAPPAPDSAERVALVDLQQIQEAAARLTVAFRRFVTDAACATLNPPCQDCADTDVLLAHVELAGCDVVRVCSATREQVLPGGSAYGEWLPKLYPLRELAERLCCRPVPAYGTPELPPDGPVPRRYVGELLEAWPRTDDLDQLLELVFTRAPGETPPKALHEQVQATPSEVVDSLQELAVLRARVTDLATTVEGLRAQLASAQEQVSAVAERVPEPAAEPAGADEPEEKPKRPRTTRARKPATGETS